MRFPPRDNVSGADGQLLSGCCDKPKNLFFFCLRIILHFQSCSLLVQTISYISKLTTLFIQLTLYSCIFTVVFAEYIFYFIIFVTVLFHRVHCKTWRMSRFFRLNSPPKNDMFGMYMMINGSTINQ